MLETRGMRFLEPKSRKLLAAAGAERVDDVGTMRIDRGLVREKLALAPREFDLRARNREHDLHDRRPEPRLHLGRRARLRATTSTRAGARARTRSSAIS